MKRNKEGKDRQKIICKYHLDKQGQRALDDFVNSNGIKYADFTTFAGFGKLSFLIGAIVKRFIKATGEAFNKLGEAFCKLGDSIKTE